MKKIILSIVAVAALASCQKSEQTSVGCSLSEVVFTSGISTRATGTLWDDGDDIGVFMYEAGSSAIYNSMSENVSYTTSGGESGTFTSLSPLLYPSDISVDFMAYYPYTTDYSNNVISLNTADQSTEVKIKAQDFMVASAQGCSEQSSSSLSFSRKMSKIVINVSRTDSRVDAVLSDISLNNVITEGSFTILNADNHRDEASVRAGTTISDISLFFNEENSVIEAIIIPQETTLTKFLLTIDGQYFIIPLSDTFAENMQYLYTLSIDDGVNFSKASITPWDPESSGELETSKLEKNLFAVDFDADNIPDENTWTIHDEGEITSSIMAGVKLALDAACKEGRVISIVMPNVTSVASSTFEDWDNLTSMDMPKLENIGGYAFQEAGLTRFDFDGVTAVGMGAFFGCADLTEVTNFKVSSIKMRTFAETGLTSFDFTWVTNIGSYSFESCKQLAEVEIPSTVEYFYEAAFRYSGVASLTLNWDGEDVIKYNNFFSSSSLIGLEVYIPYGTTNYYNAEGWGDNFTLVEMPE